MKKITTLSAFLFLQTFLFTQTPFAPIGAKWGGAIQCTPTFWPCPPIYPFFYTFEVTEDTMIQGKYCTLIKDHDWDFGNEKSIVHQDGNQIFRYDRDDETFKLVLDFSKEVGESWQIEVPEHWAGTDTLTITVTEKIGTFRQVSVDADGSLLYSDLPLYEGFGGTVYNARLLLSERFFLIVDPFVWDDLTCYIDPSEGLLYGPTSGCVPTSTKNVSLEKDKFIVSPNPASTYIRIDIKKPFEKPVDWVINDACGRIVKIEELHPNQESHSVSIENLPNGVYFWKVLSEGKVIGFGKVVVSN